MWLETSNATVPRGAPAITQILQIAARQATTGRNSPQHRISGYLPATAVLSALQLTLYKGSQVPYRTKVLMDNFSAVHLDVIEFLQMCYQPHDGEGIQDAALDQVVVILQLPWVFASEMFAQEGLPKLFLKIHVAAPCISPVAASGGSDVGRRSIRIHVPMGHVSPVQYQVARPPASVVPHHEAPDGLSCRSRFAVARPGIRILPAPYNLEVANGKTPPDPC